MEANDRKKKIAIELPHTVGLCGKTTPVVIELAEGKNSPLLEGRRCQRDYNQRLHLGSQLASGYKAVK